MVINHLMMVFEGAFINFVKKKKEKRRRKKPTIETITKGHSFKASLLFCLQCGAEFRLSELHTTSSVFKSKMTTKH